MRNLKASVSIDMASTSIKEGSVSIKNTFIRLYGALKSVEVATLKTSRRSKAFDRVEKASQALKKMLSL